MNVYLSYVLTFLVFALWEAEAAFVVACNTGLDDCNGFAGFKIYGSLKTVIVCLKSNYCPFGDTFLTDNCDDGATVTISCIENSSAGVTKPCYTLKVQTPKISSTLAGCSIDGTCINKTVVNDMCPLPKDNDNLGIIIGGVIGGVAVIGIIVAVIICKRRFKKKGTLLQSENTSLAV